MRRGVVIAIVGLGALSVVLAVAIALTGTQLDQARLERDDLEAQVDMLRSEADNLRVERDGLKTDQDSVRTQREALKSQANEQQNTIERLKAEMEQLRSQPPVVGTSEASTATP